MDCSTARLLSAFARPGHNELDPTDARALEAHVADCPDCRYQLRGEHRFDQHVAAAMNAVTVPSGLKASLLNVLADERKLAQIRIARKITFWSAAVVVLLFLFGVGIWQFTQTPPRPPAIMTFDELAATPRYWLPRDRHDPHLWESLHEWFHVRGVEPHFPGELTERLHMETLDAATVTTLFKDQHQIPIATLLLRKTDFQARVFLLDRARLDPDEIVEICHEQLQNPGSADRRVMFDPEYESYIAYVVIDSGRYEDFFKVPPEK